MGYWGKIIGGTAGFFVGGPYGAVVGAALGHAADSGGINVGRKVGMQPGLAHARVAGLLGRRDEVFAVTVTVLAARLAKCDGPVKRVEIDAFKRQFRVPSESAAQIGRLFDQARDATDSYEAYAEQLADNFADNRVVLEQVLSALFVIARVDGPLTMQEQAFLRQVHARLRLDQVAWDRAFGSIPPMAAAEGEDPYQALGISRSASPEELRTTWKQLMRENHPDSLAARGVPQEFIARASEKVARINAAWDRIKRERGL
jgi:DnaJ like chaperone protein